MSSINEKIKVYRIKSGFTQAEMAKKLGISQPAYHKIEAGKSDSLRVETLRNFCNAFGLSADELLELETHKKTLSKKDFEVMRVRGELHGVAARPAPRKKYGIKK